MFAFTQIDCDERFCATTLSYQSDSWAAETTTAHGRLILTVLDGLSELGRKLIRARTGEGREHVKSRGQHMRRPPKLTQYQRTEAFGRRDKGEETLAEIGRYYIVSPQTIERLAP